jgi:IS30 family transposase
VGHCSHLSIEEREDVMLLGRQHKGVREIARAIGRDKSTVSGELARNSSATDAAPYHRASTARRKCERRRGRCRRQSLMGDPERRALVAAKLGDERWSPEQIEGRISEERPDLAVSDTTTYRAVWSGRLDCALPGRRKMSRMLRHRGKGRRRRGSQERRGADPGAPRDSRLLLRVPPPLGERQRREHQRAPARLLPEGQEPGWRD